jgi:hypothetical protein
VSEIEIIRTVVLSWLALVLADGALTLASVLLFLLVLGVIVSIRRLRGTP